MQRGAPPRFLQNDVCRRNALGDAQRGLDIPADLLLDPEMAEMMEHNAVLLEHHRREHDRSNEHSGSRSGRRRQRK